MAVLVGVAALVTAAGCDSAEEKLEEAGITDDVPDCFPDVPLPDGDVQSGTEAEEFEGLCTTIVAVDGSPREAADEYRSKLEDEGFTISGETETGPIISFDAAKGEDSLHVSASEGGAGTSLTLSVLDVATPTS